MYVHHFPTLDSTQIRAKQLINQGFSSGTVVVADTQTGGYGKRAATWVSPPGNLYMSMVVDYQGPPQQLSIIAVVALGQTLEAHDAALPLRYKFPNDLLINGAKCGGVLIEHYNDLYVIGMGVNIAHAPALPDYPTTYLKAHTSLDQHIIIKSLMQRIAHLQQISFADIQEAWEKKLIENPASTSYPDKK